MFVPVVDVFIKSGRCYPGTAFVTNAQTYKHARNIAMVEEARLNRRDGYIQTHLAELGN